MQGMSGNTVEQNPRLTTAPSTVYNRDRERSSFLAAEKWYRRLFVFANFIMQGMSGTRTYHGRVGAGRRTAEGQGGAGGSGSERRRDSPPRTQRTLLPLGDSTTAVLDTPPEALTSEVPFKPVGEQNSR